MDRLLEIRTHGAITGNAWPGEIIFWVPEKITRPLPEAWIEA